MIWRERFQEWLNNPWLDSRTQDELNAIAAKEGEIKDRFGRMLSFGTGGLRGSVGAGTNRINRYMIRKVTQGLADWLLAEDSHSQPHGDAGGVCACAGQATAPISVCIGFDARIDSSEFAAETAAVLVANGIHAHLFKAACPTPELAFAVRRLHAAAGIMITASHNPPRDNGYKVYGTDGVQILPESARQIGKYISETPFFWRRSFPTLDEAIHQGLLTYLDQEIDQEYLKAVSDALAGYSAVVPAEAKRSFPICLTALHGVGGRYLQSLLQDLGFEPAVVEEQIEPNGAFPTLKVPNPENEAAFAFAINQCRNGRDDCDVRNGRDSGAQMILATDPDADRVACAVRDLDQAVCRSQSEQADTGDFQVLSGNQTAALLCDFVLTLEHGKSRGNTRGNSRGRANGGGTRFPEPLVATSFVTTGLVQAIAQKYGLSVLETPPGFKYIGAAAEKAARRGRPFLFGCEDSCGYLIGDYVRDKDGILGAGLLALAAAWHASRGSSFLERLSKLEAEFGCYRESIDWITATDQDQNSAFERLRRDASFGEIRGQSQRQQERPGPGRQEGFAGMEILEIRDYYKGEALNPQTGFSYNLDYSGEQALQIILSDGSHTSRITFRPSGTEPIFKIYIAVYAATESAALHKQERLRQEALSLATSIHK